MNFTIFLPIGYWYNFVTGWGKRIFSLWLFQLKIGHPLPKTPRVEDLDFYNIETIWFLNSTYWCVSTSFKNWYSNWPDASHTIWGLVDVSPTLIQDSFLRTMGWSGLRVGPLSARRVILRCKMVSIGAVWQSKNQLMKIVFCGIFVAVLLLGIFANCSSLM